MSKQPSVSKAKFLAAYSKTGNITEAARIAKIHRGTHYEWLADADYEDAFRAAHEEAVELLEAEARRRAMEGWQEPVIYQGTLCHQAVLDETGAIVRDEKGDPKLVPLTVNKKSDTLLIFLLKGAKPEKFRDNAKVELSGPGGGPMVSRVDLSGLSDEELALIEALSKKATAKKAA